MIPRYKFKLSYIIFLSVAVLFLMACSEDQVKTEIDRAETAMEADDNPRECLLMLLNIDYDSIATERQKARYGYLYARSIHKLNQQMDIDRYIKQAVEFYRPKGDSPELMKALFYYSNYLYENELNESAIKSVMKARQLAINYQDDYWRGKTAELLADILSNNHNNHEAIKYRYESAKYYSKAGREDNARYCYVDLAIAYGNVSEYNRCYELTDSILAIATAEKDSMLIAYCYSIEFDFRLKNKDYIKGEYALNKFFSMNNFIPALPIDYSNKAMIHIYKNELDSAEAILNGLKERRLDNRSKAVIYSCLQKLYKKKGLFEKALEATDSVFVFSDKDVRKSSSQVLVAAQRDYLDNDLTTANLRAERQRIIIIGCLIVSLVIIVSIVLIYRYRMRVKSVESENKIAQILAVSDELNSENERLSSAIKEHKDRLNDMEGLLEQQNKQSADVESLFHEKWSMLNFLCNEYFEKGDTQKTRDTILSRIEDELKSFRSQKSMVEFEEAVDLYMNGIASRLRRQCSFLNDSAIMFVVLCMAGLSQRAICLLLNISYNYFYTKKQRIVTRIEQSDAPDRDLFLSYLK